LDKCIFLAMPIELMNNSILSIIEILLE